MIEPPSQTLVGAEFEINNGVFVAVELLAVESVSGAVHRRGESDFGVRVDFCEIKFAEQSG